MLHKYPKLFEPVKIDYPIYDLHLDFQDYIKKSREIIAYSRQDLQEKAELIIDANTPYELRPPNKPIAGVLLIHGLLDSPFIMRDIGEALCANGLLVRSILLPGHGTTPGALLNTDYTEWLQAVRYGIATLKQDVEKIFLVGFSTGASLALYHAAEEGMMDGIMMIAPAIKLNSPFSFAINWLEALQLAWQRARWFYVARENDYVKYSSIPFNAIRQVYLLSLEINKISPAKLAYCPLFIALTYEDRIVCSKSTIQYFQQSKNPLNRMLLYSGSALKIDDPRILLRRSSYPDMNIFNFSHVTIPVTPENFHYGKNGDFPFASHIEKNVRYGALDKTDLFFRNLLYQLKLAKFNYQRLTFNPDFEFFINQLTEFVSPKHP